MILFTEWITEKAELIPSIIWEEKELAKLQFPDTSTTLLRDVSNSQHARWAIFYSKYRPLMLAYLTSHFPQLEGEDVIQETFLALSKIMLNYNYEPLEKGHFHNYVIGVLRNKALMSLERKSRMIEITRGFVSEQASNSALHQDQIDEDWRKSIFHMALERFLSDKSVHNRTKEIFKRLAVNAEKPEQIALAYGVTRNMVDQIKSRSIAKLKKIINELESV